MLTETDQKCHVFTNMSMGKMFVHAEGGPSSSWPVLLVIGRGWTANTPRHDSHQPITEVYKHSYTMMQPTETDVTTGD